jgi:hypothetical protein
MTCSHLTGSFPEFPSGIKSNIAYLDIMSSSLTKIDIDITTWPILKIIDLRHNNLTSCNVILGLKKYLNESLDTFLSSCGDPTQFTPRIPEYPLPNEPPTFIPMIIVQIILAMICITGFVLCVLPKCQRKPPSWHAKGQIV